MAPYFTSDKDVELRETSGEMNSVLGSGKLSVTSSGQEHATLLQATVSGAKNSAAAGAVTISVGNVLTFPLVTSTTSTTQKPFKVIDTRTLLFATEDYMTNYYITFPSGTDTSVVTELTRVLSALAQGAAPAAAAAAAAAEPTPRATSQPTDSGDGTKQPPTPVDSVKQVAGFMGALWNAGSGMVQKAGDEMKKKAAEDTKTLQELGSKISQRAQQDTKILMDAATGKGKATPSQDKPAEA